MQFRNTIRASFLALAALMALGADGTARAQITSAPVDTPIPSALIDSVNSIVDSDASRITSIFKDLHQHPEIGFTETRTAAIVSKNLKALGFTVSEGIAKTGDVGVLKNGAGPTLWFRADMDSNAVHEVTGLAYAATTKQRLTDGTEIDVMHACGHDAHVTWLLGVAKVMASMRAQWSGTLVVYAQPGEELGLGGMHIAPPHAVGDLASSMGSCGRRAW